MSMIIEPVYTNNELFNQIQELFKSLNREVLKEGKLVIDPSQKILAKNEQDINVLISLQKSEATSSILSIEFIEKQDGSLYNEGLNKEYPELKTSEFKLNFKSDKQFLVYLNHRRSEAQTIAYINLLDEEDWIEIPIYHEDYKLYKELNLLLVSAIDTYLGKVAKAVASIKG